MAAPRGVLHLNLNVADIVRSERFYTRALGLVRLADLSEEVVDRGRRFFLKQIVLGLPGADDLLALSEAPDFPVSPGGLNHYGLVVPDSEVEAILARVVECGGTLVRAGRRAHDGVDEAFGYVRDPDGYDLEICSQRILYAMDPRRRPS